MLSNEKVILDFFKIFMVLRKSKIIILPSLSKMESAKNTKVYAEYITKFTEKGIEI